MRLNHSKMYMILLMVRALTVTEDCPNFIQTSYIARLWCNYLPCPLLTDEDGNLIRFGELDERDFREAKNCLQRGVSFCSSF